MPKPADDAINPYIPVDEKQMTLIKVDPDWRKEWRNMPEFVQEAQEPFCEIVFAFRNEADLDEFSKLIGQTLTTVSKRTWYPKLVQGFGVTPGKRWSDES